MLKPRILVRKILVCGASGILGNSGCVVVDEYCITDHVMWHGFLVGELNTGECGSTSSEGYPVESYERFS